MQGNGSTPVNAGVNNGAFSVNWNVQSTNPFRVRVYASEDQTLDAAVNDVRIFNASCGSSTQLFACTAVDSVSCNFMNDNTLPCGTASATNPIANLTTFLNTIPKSGFLIVEACNAILTDCKVTALPVEFQ